MPPSLAARVTALEKKVVALKKEATQHKALIAKNIKEIKKLKKDYADVVKWITMETAWSTEVTGMLRQVNWGAVIAAFPGGGGGNPPQTPPDWPVT
jgi:hypothetical protein